MIVKPAKVKVGSVPSATEITRSLVNPEAFKGIAYGDVKEDEETGRISASFSAESDSGQSLLEDSSTKQQIKFEIKTGCKTPSIFLHQPTVSRMRKSGGAC